VERNLPANIQREKVELIKRTIQGIQQRGVLAEVGCFTGITTEQYRPGFERAVGFDASEMALAVAAARGIDARRWLAGAERCPASDSEFKVMVAADIIEHIVDTDGFMLELSRILAPDGFLIVDHSESCVLALTPAAAARQTAL
jgi:predicted TPR repeat methyltransferase